MTPAQVLAAWEVWRLEQTYQAEVLSGEVCLPVWCGGPEFLRPDWARPFEQVLAIRQAPLLVWYV